MSNLDIYTKDRGRAYHGPKHAMDVASRALIIRSRTKKIQPHIRHSDEVLEFGIGHGWNLLGISCARKFGYDVASYLGELYDEKSGIEFNDSLDNLSATEFDVVVCHHVIEHVDSPLCEVRKMNSLIREGGKLVLFVPSETQRRFNKHNPIDTDHHLYTWNIQSAFNLLKAAGFRSIDIRIKNFGYERFAAEHVGKYGFAVFVFLINVLRMIRPVKELEIIAIK